MAGRSENIDVHLSKFLWVLIDFVYPSLQPLSKKEEEQKDAREKEEKEKTSTQIKELPDDDDLLTQYLNRCSKLLEEASETRRSIEARLTSMIGLSSIAGTLVFAGILALATGTLYVKTFSLRLLIAVGALYLVLQICCAVHASVRGLQRRSYLAAQVSDVLPLSRETHTGWLRRQIALYPDRLLDMRSNNNEKVSLMAVAQRAMINFVGGLTLLALIGTVFALTAGNTNDKPIHTLWENQNQNELLRDPQGAKGEPKPPSSATEPILEQQPPCVRKR